MPDGTAGALLTADGDRQRDDDDGQERGQAETGCYDLRHQPATSMPGPLRLARRLAVHSRGDRQGETGP
jgi:hypothetical protein